MLYDYDCGDSNPWFDVTTGHCRGEAPGVSHDGQGASFTSNAGCTPAATGALKLCNDGGVLKLLDGSGVVGTIDYTP